MVAWQLGLYVYARWAKRKLIVGNLLVATITSSVFLAGALLTQNVAAAAIPVTIAFVFVSSRELVKGAEDLEGDRASGVSTVAVVAGLDRTVVLASAMMLLLAAAIPSPALAGHYGRPYLWVMELAVVPGLLAASYAILKYPGRKSFGRVSWLLKIEMFFGILAMGLGRL
jgi:geranylgeranylglycerol-phosphate geranylgeranyltransferase